MSSPSSCTVTVHVPETPKAAPPTLPPPPKPPWVAGVAVGGRSVIGLPSMNSCVTRTALSFRSPRVTVRFAILPTSREPSRSDTPKISAARSVTALTASSAPRPFSTARCTLGTKSPQLVRPPDWNANFTPAVARRPGPLGVSTRSRSTRTGSGSASAAGACTLRGKLSERSTGTFSALRRSATFHASLPPARMTLRLNSLARSRARSISRCELAIMTTGCVRLITGCSASSCGSNSGRRIPRGFLA